MDCIFLTQDMDRWRAVVNTLTDLVSTGVPMELDRKVVT